MNIQQTIFFHVERKKKQKFQNLYFDFFVFLRYYLSKYEIQILFTEAFTSVLVPLYDARATDRLILKHYLSRII